MFPQLRTRLPSDLRIVFPLTTSANPIIPALQDRFFLDVPNYKVVPPLSVLFSVLVLEFMDIPDFP